MSEDDPGPIHVWFGLSYASYLVLPRSILQSMPAEWQARLVALLDEADLSYGGMCPGYKVLAVADDGRFIADPFKDYERGRRRVPPKG